MDVLTEYFHMASKLVVGLIGVIIVIRYELEKLNREKGWMEDTLAGIGRRIEDVYFAEWNPEIGWHIQDYDNNLYDID